MSVTRRTGGEAAALEPRRSVGGRAGGLGGVSREMDVVRPRKAHRARDQVVPGDLVDEPEHLLTDLPVARVSLRGRAQLDEMHRLARVELDHVAHPVTKRHEVAGLLREGVDDLAVGGLGLADGEFFVLLYDFKLDVAKYFATRVGVPVAGGTLQTAIDFNNAHAADEMPFFNQDIFDLAQTVNPDPNVVDPNFGLSYNQALAIDHDAGVNGIDKAIAMFHLDAVVTATDNPAWSTDLIYGDHFIYGTSGLAAAPGYPIVQVPAGMVFGTPLGISFFGSAFSEPTLIKLASGFEAVTQVRAHNLPTFAATVPFNNIQGTTPRPSHGHKNYPKGPNSNQKTPHHM